MMRTLALLACLAPALPASAYCIHNDLKGREVRVAADLRRGNLDIVIRPGDKFCCNNKDLECNPEGKITANLDLSLTILGEPAYQCGIPDRSGALLKITGGGTVRVVNNPKAGSALPYVVRVRTQDRDVSGPSGVACNEATKK